MDLSNQNLSDIQRFYKNSTVFLSGATGFIGKLYLEKVLRSLPVKKVFLLVREKKDTSAEKRFQEIFNSPAFDVIKRTDPSLFNKVSILVGNCALSNLGLSPKDKNTFIEEVDVIFHCAATVRFDQHIATATFTNVRGTRDLIQLAKQIKKLKTFVYIGTAYSNCLQSEIQEKVYEPTISAEKLIAACESLDKETLTSVEPTLIGNWPNTYTFTKQVTEDYIDKEGRGLPICITRPGVVTSTESEPITAFVDNVFTLAGFALSCSLGLTRISYYKNTLLNIIPVDYVINECIAAGWQTGENFKPYRATDIPVYNICTSTDNPVTQDQVYDNLEHYGRKIPTPNLPTYPYYFRTTCKYNYLFFRFFFHTLVAHCVDFGLKLQGKEPLLKQAVQKLHKFQESYEFFTTKQSYYHTENTQRLLKRMTYKDKELFYCDVTRIKWDTYLINYMKGLRVYLLKEPMTNLAEGVLRYRRLRNYFILTLLLVAVGLYGLIKITLWRVLPAVFRVVLYLLRSAIC